MNEVERHRARRIYSKGVQAIKPEWLETDLHLERLSAEGFSDAFIQNNPYSRSDWDPRNYSSVRSYSENAPEGISCAAVNNFLRHSVLPVGISEQELVSFIKDMNASISNFIIGKASTFYRGMHFKPGDAYLSGLDHDYEAMVVTGRPVKLVEKGFMSVSRSLETAKAYALEKESELCHVYVSVTIEKGIAAMPLSFSRGTAAKNSDKEVLLASGGTYYIIGMDIVRRGNGLYDYYINLLATNRRI